MKLCNTTLLHSGQIMFKIQSWDKTEDVASDISDQICKLTREEVEGTKPDWNIQNA